MDPRSAPQEHVDQALDVAEHTVEARLGHNEDAQSGTRIRSERHEREARCVFDSGHAALMGWGGKGSAVSGLQHALDASPSAKERAGRMALADGCANAMYSRADLSEMKCTTGCDRNRRATVLEAAVLVVLLRMGSGAWVGTGMRHLPDRRNWESSI